MTGLEIDRGARVSSDPGSILSAVDHRPWALPDRPWVMYQRWVDLLFMHWTVSPHELASHVPDGLVVDVYDDRAWVSVTPFEVQGLRFRGLPVLPGLSTFPEVNVRTYVRVNGKPGVFFFSLDAGSRLAVEAARLTYALPYFRASMRITRRGHRIVYESTRTDRRAASAALRVEYGPTGPIARAPAGSLAHWLTERYCLYAVRRRAVYEAEIHHRQWSLQDAAASVDVNTMPHDIHLPPDAPILHFSSRLDVLVWAPRRVR